MPSPRPIWNSLQETIKGDIVLPGSPDFHQRVAAFNARFGDVRPVAMVSCATPQDISETIAFTSRHDLQTAARSGGHSFAGHSSTRGVVIDVTSMNAVSVSGDVATVGAGARLGEVYDALQEHGLAIPAGTCPPVGVAGQTLGGGLGILGRKYGVTSDHLVGAQIVLADGRILECDENTSEDLFWALRGAGSGNFGVVTSLTFRTVPAPTVTNLHLSWTQSDAVALIEAWQTWAPRGPDELAASLKVTGTGSVHEPPSVDVYGALLGTESDAMELLDDLVARVGSDPITTLSKHMSFPETRRFWAHLGAAEDELLTSSDPSPQRPYLFAKSEFFSRPLTTDAIEALIRNFARARASGESRELDFMPWGGAYTRVRPEATAFVHRDELFLLKHAAVIDPQPSTNEKEAAHRWVTSSWMSVHPWGSGRVFQNFADPELEDWGAAYYGSNFERLVQIKARYDPANVFHFDQSLPLSRT
jgi:FAD/FMN-containing dehydrogenase